MVLAAAVSRTRTALAKVHFVVAATCGRLDRNRSEARLALPGTSPWCAFAYTIILAAPCERATPLLSNSRQKPAGRAQPGKGVPNQLVIPAVEFEISNR